MSTLPRDRISRVVLCSFAVILVTLAVAFIWIGRESDRSEVALSRDVRTIVSARTLDELKACLGYELRMDAGRNRVVWNSSGVWSSSARGAGGLRAFNSMTDLGVRLLERGGTREVVISTRQARALRPAEVNVINRCTGTG